MTHTKFIISQDLYELKNKVYRNNLEWRIIDKSKFNSSIKENYINIKNIQHRKWSYTGIYRVRKIKVDEINQGFIWNYRIKSKGNLIDLYSTDLCKLKEKVLKRKINIA